MTELILGKNKDNFSKKRDCGENERKNNLIKSANIHNIDSSRLENSNSEKRNIFNHQEIIKNHNELDEINENFNDINERSASEKTDNISNLSAENNFKNNFLKSQRLLEKYKEKNSNIDKEEKDDDQINRENKPRFAISHKLRSKNLDNSIDDYTCYEVVDQRGCNEFRYYTYLYINKKIYDKLISLLKHIVIEIKNTAIKSFDMINIDSFSNSIKYIKDSTVPITTTQKGCMAFLKCLRKKKTPPIDINLNIDISNIIMNLRKLIKEFFKNNNPNMLNEKPDDILDLEKIDNIIQETCFNKYQYLAEANNLDDKLKDEVDKYSNYFNIEKILKKQSSKIKSQNKKIEQQEDAKIAIECIICIENIRNTVFYPCMHLITCEECGFDKIKLDCPQCHQKIDKKVIVSI